MSLATTGWRAAPTSSSGFLCRLRSGDLYDVTQHRHALAHRGDTLGGYVRMRGDETEAGGEAEGASSSGSFAAAGLWWRIAIVAAGPMANFILGILLFAMVYMTAGKIFRRHRSARSKRPPPRRGCGPAT